MKLKRWLTILLFTILSLSTFAQGSTAVYPVEVSTFITPPYGTCLKDFVGSQRFQVHVLLRDLTKKNDDFVIIMSVKDMGGKTIFRSNVGQFTFANRGTMIVPAEVNTHILQNLFQPANIEIGEKYATNCFPEGAYTISFQAFDAKFYNIAKRRIPLSRESVTQLFMQSSTDKVYLVYPYKDETICSTINGSVINYQWQPANPTGEIISYHLEVVKLESEFEKQSPKSAFARTTRVLDVDNLYRSIYTDHILTTNYTEGNFYAWRVTVKKGYEQTASTAETNQEIRVFEYRCNALEPVADTYDPLIIAEKQLDKNLDKITLKEVSNTGADALLKWKEDPAEIRKKYCGVGIEIRKFGGEKWTAFKNTTTEEFEYSLSQLSRNVSYEARAHYIQCPDETHEDSIYGPYSDIIEFSIPKENDESECGSPIPDLSDCTDKKAKILRAGDTIIANGTKVFVDKITEYSADSTEITGEGHVCFPIITNIQLRMKFDKIKINCAGELANGEIHAVYDVSTCAMIDLEELTGEGFTGGTEKSASESQINDMKDFDKGSAGDYFKDEKGTVYMKDENGEKVEIGKILTLDNTQFSFDHDRLASQDHFVIFSNPTPETIAFDNDKDGFYRAIRGSNYSSYSDKYIIPYLANIPGLIKTLNAEEVRVNDRVDLFEDVKFVIESSDGSYLELTKTVLDEKTNKFEIKVPGTSDYEHLTYVRVIGKPKDSEQYQIAGKLIVCNFKKQTHNLVIVPTLSSYSVDESKIANELNRIYGRIGISFNVTVDKSFVDKQEVLELLENGLDISTDDQEKHSWDVESPDMKKIRRLYQESHSDISTKKAAYLFLVNRPEDKYSSVDGDMPRNQSVGYIFMKDKNELTDVRLIAHELGHGVFRLQHTFAYKGMDETKKKTDNLMDYNPSNPDFLAYYQWNVLQDSAFFVWKALQDDEDGMLFTDIIWLGDWVSNINVFDTKQANVENVLNLLRGYKNYLSTNKWNTTEYKKTNTNVDLANLVRKKESFKLPLKNKTYCPFKLSDKLGEDFYSDMFFFSFEDNPMLSGYKIKELSDLRAYGSQVKAGFYYKDGLSFGIIAFFKKDDTLQALLEIDLKNANTIDEAKEQMEGWVDYFLMPNSVSNKLYWLNEISDGSSIRTSVEKHIDLFKKIDDNIANYQIKRKDFNDLAITDYPKKGINIYMNASDRIANMISIRKNTSFENKGKANRIYDYFEHDCSFESGYKTTDIAMIYFSKDQIYENYKIADFSVLGGVNIGVDAALYLEGGTSFGIISFYSPQVLKMSILIDIHSTDKTTALEVLKKWVAYFCYNRPDVSKYKINISKFNGVDYKLSKKIDDNSACSNELNPEDMDVPGYTQYLYLKPYEKCTLEFSLNVPDENDLSIVSKDNRLNIVSSSISHGRATVVVQSTFGESIVVNNQNDLPAIHFVTKGVYRLIYSMIVIPCRPQTFNIAFVEVNGTTKDGKSVSCSNIDYAKIKRFMKSVYDPINISFTYSNKMVESGFDFNILSANYSFREVIDGERQNFVNLMNKYNGKGKYTFIFVPFKIDEEADGKRTLGYAALINDNYPAMNEKSIMVISAVDINDYPNTSPHECGHSIFGLYHPFDRTKACIKGSDQLNSMDYYQEDPSILYLRAYDVYKIKSYLR